MGHQLMVATRLKAEPEPLIDAALLVVELTAAGAICGAICPSLAGHVPPHPTLHGTLGDAASILANNVRVLAAPFVAVVVGFQETSFGRRVGDLLVILIAAVSAVPVGIALAHWGTRLTPYVPQLPTEWAALAIAIATWIDSRDRTTPAGRVGASAVAVLLLLVISASLETWCTPHRHTVRPARQSTPVTVREPIPMWMVGWLPAPRILAPVRPHRFKVARSLPLTPFGSARPHKPALTGLHQPPRPPQEGSQK